MISRRLDAELPAGLEPRLDEHLARCAGCQAWAREQEAASRRLRSALAVAPGELEAIERAVLEGAARGAGSPAPARIPVLASIPRRLLRLGRPAAAFAAAVLVGAGLWMGTAWIIRSGAGGPGGPIARPDGDPPGVSAEAGRPILILERASRELDLFPGSGGLPAGLETRRNRTVILDAPARGAGPQSPPDLMLELEEIDPRYILSASHTWH